MKMCRSTGMWSFVGGWLSMCVVLGGVQAQQPGQVGGPRPAGPIQPAGPVQPKDPVFSTPQGQANPQGQGSNVAGPRVAGQPPAGQFLPGQPLPGIEAPMIPCPFPPLPADHARFLDSLLTAWEAHSNKIERFRCSFDRWEYDPVFGPPNPNEAKTHSTGKMQYAKPDKGLFRLDMVERYMPAREAGQPATMANVTEAEKEHWVCDGSKIYEFNHKEKQLIERVLPLELQGKAIVDGPLPFFFGADPAKVKSRFWLRLVTPADLVEKEFWLEATPKYRHDAMNFKTVHVILDRKEFLIQAMQLFDPGYDPQKNPKRVVFTFKERETNFNQGIKALFGDFSKPTTPLGWTFLSEPYVPDQALAALYERQQQESRQPSSNTERPGAAASKLIPFKRK